MERMSLRWSYAIMLGVLAALALVAGCGKPRPAVPPAQFVGTWMAPPPGTKELKPGTYPTLTLNPDGTGLYTQYPDPHPQNISWVIRSGRFVMADRDGSGSTTYAFSFNGPDELTLAIEGGKSTFTRYKEGQEQAPSQQQAPALPGAPTRGGSTGPPARSRR